MFSEFKPFISILIKSVPVIYKYLDDKKRFQKFLDLQEAYFIIAALLDTGEELLKIAESKPEVVIGKLTREEINQHYVNCQRLLLGQNARMGRLSEIFLEKPFIDFHHPNLRKDLNKAIGTKFEGLYSIGAALSFHQMFGSSRFQDETDFDFEKRAATEQFNLIADLFNIRPNDPIDLTEQRLLLEEMRRLNEKLREIINNICSDDEKMKISEEAEKLSKKFV